MKKRIVSLVMAIAMCLSLSVTAFAAEAKDFSPSKVEFEDIPRLQPEPDKAAWLF